MFHLFLLAFVVSCSHPPPTTKVITSSVTFENENQLELERKKAEQFERFVRGKLPRSEVEALKQFCKTNPNENRFCYSIIHAEEYSARLDKKNKPQPSKRIRAVYPKFKGDQNTNWLELRFAPISATIRTTGNLNQRKISLLQKLALEEKNCPNNIAISVAAALEDQLPLNSKLTDIGALYQKGAECLDSQPEDQASLLTRAGLFFFAAKDYPLAKTVFSTVVAKKDVFINRALFWLFRTLQETNQKSDSESLVDQMKAKYPFSFHTILAQLALGREPTSIINEPLASRMTRSVESPKVNSLIDQAEILHYFKFEEAASTVLDWALLESEGVEPEVRVYLAELTPEHSATISILAEVLYDHPQLINRKTFDLYFPRAFFPIFQEHSGNVDPYLLMAVARQESAFNPYALSPANARGLLQVMPATGRRISHVSPKALWDPTKNVQIGAKYFEQLLANLDGQIHLALAAYNAGPSRVKTWTERYPSEDPILFTDLIPYRETQNYVALVLRNYYWYRAIYTEEKTTPSQWLGQSHPSPSG